MKTSRIPTERSFGVSVGLVCATGSAFSIWRGHEAAATVLAVLGGVLLAGGVLAPTALRAPNRVWWRVTTAVGWLNTRVILTLFFILVLTPVGMLMRLIGRNPLRARQPRTTWSAYPAGRRDSRHYEHLF